MCLQVTSKSYDITCQRHTIMNEFHRIGAEKDLNLIFVLPVGIKIK